MIEYKQRELEWQNTQQRETLKQKEQLIDQLLKRIADLEKMNPCIAAFTSNAEVQTEPVIFMEPSLSKFELSNHEHAASTNTQNERSIVNYY